MADWTAITGIVVSGVVGPGLGALYASRRLVREHEYGRFATDRSEARSVLDETTQHLQRAGRLRGALYPQFVTHGRHTAELASTHMQEFHEAARLVDLDTSRLELRFGVGSEVVDAHRAARDAIVQSSDAIGDAGRLGELADLRETNDQLKASREAYDVAEMRYMAAAHRLAKVQLALTTRRFLWRR